MSEKVLLREWYPLSVDKGVISESIRQNDGKLFLKGSVQEH